MADVRLDRIVRDAIDERGEPGWQVTIDPPWCRVEPPDYRRRVQGWKLHVSATPLSAPLVLARCLEVLLPAGVAFKVAATLDDVHVLTDPRCDRTSGGKVITVYPGDDASAVTLAESLHDATFGLPGQEILSDARYRPGSLVHYRFGAFAGVVDTNLDGRRGARLRTPEGVIVDDDRNAWYSPPAWAKCPFPAMPEPAGPRTPPSAVLIGGRFAVHGAIRLVNRGGVYRAKDQETGADVIIKQARAHTGAQITGGDARDALRHEARVLDELRGLVPDLVCVFEQESDVFLVESSVPGRTLRAWIADGLEEDDRDPVSVPVEDGLAVARRLVRLLGDVHERGLVCRDFTPNNIMVRPGGELCLIDPELCVRPGAPTIRSYTPGFGAPEQVHAPRLAPAPGPAVDLYALGTTLYLLATGMEPLLTADEPDVRDPAERFAERLAAITSDSPIAARLAPVIIGLTARDPERRWSLDRVRVALDAPAQVVGARPEVPVDRMIDDGLDHLVASMTPERNRLWPAVSFGRLIDECAVQYGAGGVLEVLVRAAADRPDLIPTVRTAADWIADRLAARDHHRPGLHFGSAGPVWALHDASVLLGDDELAGRALALARQLPVRWPLPDVCHGTAGAGLALLALWRATGADDLADRITVIADGLTATADRSDGRITWPFPTGIDSALAGLSHYGFAHGVAGIGTFLLAAATTYQREDWLTTADLAGRTLLAAADRSRPGARWQGSTRGEPSGREFYYHWCSGSSGVGTFLIRLAGATGDARYAQTADDAAVAVHRMRWTAGTAACHGLAGNGEFLLDLADAATTEQARDRYRRWAGDLAGCLYAHHAVRDGRVVTPEESGSAVTADAQTGLAGTVGFLLRLRRGGPRSWLADAAMSSIPA